MIEIDEIRRRFSYDPVTGHLLWAMPNHGVTVGKRAGRIKNKYGYRRVQVNLRFYAEHRLIWAYVHGYWPQIVDHINGVRDDNRISNLREVDDAKNCYNSAVRKDNALGVRGVHFCKTKNKFVVRVGRAGKVIAASFHSLEEAANHALELRSKIHGEYAVDKSRAVIAVKGGE